MGATSVTFVLPWLSFIYIPCIFDEFCDAALSRGLREIAGGVESSKYSEQLLRFRLPEQTRKLV